MACDAVPTEALWDRCSLRCVHTSRSRSIRPSLGWYWIRGDARAPSTRADVGWFARNILFGFILCDEVADKEAMEDYLAATDLDWTVVRVGILADGPAKDHFRAADDHTIRGMGKITRQNVA